MQGQVRSPAELERLKNSAGNLRMLERTQAKHEEMNFHFSRPHTVLSVALLDEIDLMN